MTAFDFALLIIFGVSMCLGAWRGVFGEIIALSAWVLAFLAAKFFGQNLADSLLQSIAEEHLRLVVAWILIFIAVLIVMGMVRLTVKKLMSAVGLGLADRFFGLVFGFTRAFMIVFIIVAFLGMTTIPEQLWWKNAYFSEACEQVVLYFEPYLPQQISSKIHF